MQTAYVAIIEKGLEGYGVFFPDIPGLTSFGATPGEAAANAAIAAQGHVALTQELGEQLAPPTALEDVEIEGDIQEISRVMILVETADEKQRVNITLPKSVLAALDGIAGLRGQDRSSMIADLVRGYVDAPLRQETQPGNHYAPATRVSFDACRRIFSGQVKPLNEPFAQDAWILPTLRAVCVEEDDMKVTLSDGMKNLAEAGYGLFCVGAATPPSVPKKTSWHIMRKGQSGEFVSQRKETGGGTKTGPKRG